MNDRTHHRCHAEACEVRVPPAKFMCKRHWKGLPGDLKSLVWKFYVPGQEDRLDPSYDYLYASQRVVEWLADQEGIIGHTALSPAFVEHVSDQRKAYVDAVFDKITT